MNLYYQPSPFELMPNLQTPRLLMRKMTMRDADDVFRYSSDPEVARHVLWDAHRSVSESRAYLRFMLRKYRQGSPSSWGIVLRESGRLIGTIGYMWYQQENRSVEIGYSLARPYWSQGLMTEAVKAVIEHSFNQLPIHRIEAQHEVDNPASGIVMKKAGMHCEGTLRGRLYNKGKFVDVVLYSILNDDPRDY